MRELLEYLGIVAVTCVIVAVLVLGLAAFMESTKQDCAPNYFWSYRENACLPGYRPSELGR